MRIVVAGDHAGYPLKSIIIEDLIKAGHTVSDLGTNDPAKPDDYPDFAEVACEAIRRGEAERAVVICGSGVGVTVAANKFPGIRAGLCHDHYSAHQGVEHDDMNVLCLGARIVGQEVAREIVRSFAEAEFTGEERHARRLNKVKAIENKYLRGE
ncbi:MAG: ribose 5-phosphate isomerase B [Deltaproteobacteria bacterium]